MNNKFKHIIFDLDGTISDSREGIMNSVIYSAKKMSLHEPSTEELKKLIGIPLQEYYERIFGLHSDEIDNAVKLFRKYYGEKGAFENRLYPGMFLLLEDLFNNNVKLYIATAKYEKYASVVTNYFNITKFLTDLIGADEAGKNAGKTELVEQIIRRNNINKNNSIIMIGDTSMDIISAKMNNINSIAVTYGYGVKNDLKKEQPDFIASNVEDLRKILLK